MQPAALMEMVNQQQLQNLSATNPQQLQNNFVITGSVLAAIAAAVAAGAFVVPVVNTGLKMRIRGLQMQNLGATNQQQQMLLI